MSLLIPFEKAQKLVVDSNRSKSAKRRFEVESNGLEVEFHTDQDREDFERDNVY